MLQTITWEAVLCNIESTPAILYLYRNAKNQWWWNPIINRSKWSKQTNPLARVAVMKSISPYDYRSCLGRAEQSLSQLVCRQAVSGLAFTQTWPTTTIRYARIMSSYMWLRLISHGMTIRLVMSRDTGPLLEFSLWDFSVFPLCCWEACSRDVLLLTFVTGFFI